ncbi:MAG: sulfatase-like hydrolase/transferase, partial [Armatimonadetes bacterium]|nr:sulfatase-like hydrolase/transferase [Armatimonadota bacterium]
MSRARNLLVLLCDQLQADCMSLYGGPVPTPNFERVAQRGAVFDRFFCALPMCAPTRPSMMTGRWPHQHGAICNTDARYSTVNDDEELLIDRLQDQGFHVGYDGIWHILRTPRADRRAEYAHFRRGLFPYRLADQMLREMGRDPGEQRAAVVGATDEGREEKRISVPTPVTWTPGAASHPDMTRALRMARFILEAPADRPLAAWCSLGGPHPPLVVPEPWMSMFDPAELEPPPGFDEEPDALPRSVRESPGLQGVRGWSWEEWAPAVAAYYGYVAFVDHCQGVVLDALERSGRLDDTVIIMSTDHGEMLGAHGIYQKFVMYEQSARVPFVISAPGVEPGR